MKKLFKFSFIFIILGPQNQNNSLNKSYDSQNYNSLQTGRNNFHDNNNQASASKINIDENASDVKTIESNLLVLQLQKQEVDLAICFILNIRISL